MIGDWSARELGVLRYLPSLKFFMPEVIIKNYVVAFLDLLGQRADMAGLLFMPPKTQPEARKDFTKKVFRSVGAVHFIQSQVQLYTNLSNDWHDTPAEGLDPNKQQVIQKYRISSLRTQRFSDGIVIFCPLDNDDHFAINSVCSLLVCCASTMVVGLAQGYPFRAGIAIGAGCSINGDDIYGPVLAEAYRLESTVALYPRVVVSDEFNGWLQSLERKDLGSAQDRSVTLALKKFCEPFLMEDSDGRLAVDYLKNSTLNALGGAKNTDASILGMRKFVEGSIARFTGGDEQQSYIRAKYESVLSYINRRLPSGVGG